MRASHLVVVDVGNTSTALGLYRAGRVVRRARILTTECRPSALEHAVRRLVGSTPVQGAMIASVVPARDALWRAVLSAAGAGPVHVVRHTLDLGVAVSYLRPERVGTDRLANASAGVARFGAPLIVVDLGTATSFDVVERGRGFTGGVIAPGPGLMLTYLAEKTARLPRLAPRLSNARLGRSTEQAMQLGAQWGYRGMVREILAELRKARELRRATVCVTGGYGLWLARGWGEPVVVDPDLTLRGIGRIHDLNFGPGKASA